LFFYKIKGLTIETIFYLAKNNIYFNLSIGCICITGSYQV